MKNGQWICGVIAALLTAIFFALAGCGGDGSLDDINAADFGPGVTPTYATISILDGYTTLDSYLKSIADKPGNYAITVVGQYHQIAHKGTYDYSIELASGVNISLRGNGTLIKTGRGTMWLINSGAKLILRGPTLDGIGKSGSIVEIGGGKLVMEDGTIKGAGDGGYYDYGGVYFNGGGDFIMNGGTITDNSSGYDGGGVNAGSSDSFIMNGGVITNNSAVNFGGGVDTGNGSFIMNGGSITNNTAGDGGGGVYAGSEFTKTGNSSITGNKVTTGNGKAVFVYVDGTNDRYRDTDAGAGVNITIPSDESKGQGSAPWL